MTRSVPVVHRLRSGTEAQWAVKNRVLALGEPGLALFPDGSQKMKVGDGVRTWLELEYYLPESAINAAINAAIAATLGSGSGGEAPPADLAAHISDPTPHSVYDDGPSLALKYQNAKV